MNRTLILTLLLTICCLRAIPQNDGDDIVIGKYRKLHSAVTNEDRTLLVWLPPSYDQTTLSYPVMYVLYGQNISGYMLPAITACDMLATSGVIPEMIIVGVANAERYRDYTSIADGYIENTVKFFTDELFPFIESNYRTKNYRIVNGPQAGAVFSFYTLLKHPQLSNAYITENPFVGQNRDLLYNMSKELITERKISDKFLYITEENNRIPVNIETAKQFEELVTASNPAGFELHLEIAHPSGYFVPPIPVKEALLRLFREYAFPDSLKVKNLDEIKNFYRSVSSRYGVEFQPPEMILTFKSDEFTSTGRNAEASELLEYQLSLYPKSLNALMRMGDLKRSAGDYESAIKYYDEFLKISSVDAIAIRNRRDELAKKMLEKLKTK